MTLYQKFVSEVKRFSEAVGSITALECNVCLAPA